MVSVTPLWGVNDKTSLQQHGSSLLSYNASSLIVGEWPHLCLAGIMIWTKIDVTLFHCPLYELVYNPDYYLPLISRLSIFGTITRMWRVFSFFWCGCGAWRSTPRINCSVAAWHTSWPHVILLPTEGSRFR